MRNLFPFYLLCLSLAFTSCGDEPDDGGDLIPESRKAIIGVEGVVPNGISSLGEYDITGQTLDNNVFRKANVNTLGSGLSDLYADKEAGLLFAVLPSSEVMAVCDLNTYELLELIPISDQAKNIIKATPTKYYMTTWASDEILVRGPNKFRVINTIDAGLKPDEMVIFEDLVFVSNTGVNQVGNTVTIVRSTADTVVATLPVGDDPASMAIDYTNNLLYIMCSGLVDTQNPLLNGIGSLWRYNLDSMITAIDSGNAIVFDTVLFFTDNQIKPQHLVVDEEAQNLYYTDNAPTGNIMIMPATAKRVAEVPAINGNFYGLEFDQIQNELYGLNTPSDIDETGSVQVFNPDLSLKVSHRIGSKPREVEFK